MIGDLKTQLFVQQAVARGDTKEVIYQKLLASGGSLDVIETLYDEAVAKKAVTAASLARLQDRLAYIVTIAAVVLLIIGVISFVAANWWVLSASMRMAVLVGTMLVAYAVGWRLSAHDHLTHVSHLTMLAGTIMFGACIFLIGLSQNVQGGVADAIALWFVGVVVLAIALDSYMLYIGAAVLAFTTLVASGATDPILTHLSLTSRVVSTMLFFLCSALAVRAAMIINKRMPKVLQEKF